MIQLALIPGAIQLLSGGWSAGGLIPNIEKLIGGKSFEAVFENSRYMNN